MLRRAHVRGLHFLNPVFLLSLYASLIRTSALDHIRSAWREEAHGSLVAKAGSRAWARVPPSTGPAPIQTCSCGARMHYGAIATSELGTLLLHIKNLVITFRPDVGARELHYDGSRSSRDDLSAVSGHCVATSKGSEAKLFFFSRKTNHS